jgi:hypothetical protein
VKSLDTVGVVGSKKNDAVDKVSGHKITHLRREEKERVDLKELQEWSLLCGKCGQPVGECECD